MRSLLLVLLALSGSVARAEAQPDSLASHVPADVSFFAELRGGEPLLMRLLDPELWSTLSELSGMPAEAGDTRLWAEQIRKSVGMSPAEAVRALLAEQVAFVGAGPGRARDAVLLCRPPQGDLHAALLERWRERRVQPQPPGRLDTFHLHNNLGMAQRDDLLLFGDVLRPDGLFFRLASRAAPESRLAEDAKYRELIERLGGAHEGLLYLRQAATPSLAPGIASAPASMIAPRDARTLVGLVVETPDRLRFEVVTDRPHRVDRSDAAPLRLAAALPESILILWEGRVDFAQLIGSLNQLPEQNVFHLFHRLLKTRQSLEALVDALGERAALAIGLVPQASAPPLPAAAMLMETRDAQTAFAEFSATVDAGVAMFNVVSLTRGGRPLPGSVESTTAGGVVRRSVDLSGLLDAWGARDLSPLELTWCVHDGRLMIASHGAWLEQLSDASAPRLKPGFQPSATSANHILIHSAVIADAGELWIARVREIAPHALTESWWRERQPGGARPPLGVIVTPEVQDQRLRVTRVDPERPATGLIRAGDYILGANGARFRGPNLVGELQQAILARPQARWIDLQIRRGEHTFAQRLALPFFNPVQALQRVIALGRVAQRIEYLDDLGDVRGVTAKLAVDLAPASPQTQPAGSAVVPIGETPHTP